MVVKSLNVEEETYAEFSKYCKDFGLSMSKQINLFMKTQLEDEPKIKKEYLEKLERIHRGKFITVKGSLLDRYKHLQPKNNAKSR